MEKEEEKVPNDQERVEEEDTEALELVLFQVSECYVYLVSFLGISLLGFYPIGLDLLMILFEQYLHLHLVLLQF